MKTAIVLGSWTCVHLSFHNPGVATPSPKPMIKPLQHIPRESESSEDKAWLTRQEKSNKKRNLLTKLVFPT